MLFTAVTLGLAALAQAANIDVQVGISSTTVDPKNFRFTPNNFTANQGDVVRFNFSGVPGNHTITQSSLAKPCDPLQGGFDSGWVFIPPGTTGDTPTWELTITDTSKPIWFYCKQTAPVAHCGVGMVGAINANETTWSTFAQNAAGNTSPGQGVGALVGVGASASADPGPITGSIAAFGAPGSGSATGSGSAPAPSSSDSGNNGASTMYMSAFAATIAAVMGISLA